jgi:hypothetical protein
LIISVLLNEAPIKKQKGNSELSEFEHIRAGQW